MNIKNTYKPVFDYKDQIVMELFTSENKEIWFNVFDWWFNIDITNQGEKYIWDTFFAGKHVQSIAMYREMVKTMLYTYRAVKDKEFPYEYSSSRVNKIVSWFSNYKLSQGTFAGQEFILRDPQVYLLLSLYGLNKKEKFKEDIEKGKGLKFPTQKMIFNATRKNGKSEFFAGLGVFLQQNPFNNSARPEIYASGPKKDTSDIIWEKAQFLAKSNEEIKALYLKINTRHFWTVGRGKFVSLPFEKSSIEGQNPDVGIITEYHLVDSDEVVESFESAMNISRINPLLLFDTTKGEGIYGVAYNREMEYKEITIEQLNEPDKIIGIQIRNAFWELDTTDNFEWFENDFATNPLRKSTPMLGEIIQLSMLQDEWLVAKRDPLKRREFLIKKAGLWIGNQQALFEIRDIEECNEKNKDKYILEELAKSRAEAIIIVDLANTQDTNAVTLMFKDEINGEVIPICFSHTYIPSSTLEERVAKERKPYHKWEEQGYVSLSGTKSVDHKDIAEYIVKLIKKYNVKKICYDRWNFHIVKTYLQDMGKLSKEWFEQVNNNAAELSSPLEDLVKKINKKSIYFFDNPQTTDHILNFKPIHNSSGHMYFVKTKQTNRIDILATLVMGMSRLDLIKPIGKVRKAILQAW